jgi:hypothetical protein
MDCIGLVPGDWEGVPAAMDDADDTFRLASGVFYEPRALGSVVADLHANGFKRRDMCLAGTRPALSGVMQPESPAFPVLGSLEYGRVRPLYPLPGDVEVVGTNGVLLRKLLREAAWTQGDRALTSSWLLPDVFARFTDHVRQNAVVLLVSSADSGQQHRSCRILLRHSADTVQTHEFTPSRGARQ